MSPVGSPPIVGQCCSYLPRGPSGTIPSGRSTGTARGTTCLGGFNHWGTMAHCNFPPQRCPDRCRPNPRIDLRKGRRQEASRPKWRGHSTAPDHCCHLPQIPAPERLQRPPPDYLLKKFPPQSRPAPRGFPPPALHQPAPPVASCKRERPRLHRDGPPP